MSLRDQILAADDKLVEPCITEWKDAAGKPITVWIRSLTAGEVERHASSMRGKDGQLDSRKTKESMARLIALSVVDKDGNRVFNAADAAALNQKSARLTSALVKRINELNGFDDDDAELLGDFGDAPSDDSPSDSQDISD